MKFFIKDFLVNVNKSTESNENVHIYLKKLHFLCSVSFACIFFKSLKGSEDIGIYKSKGQKKIIIKDFNVRILLNFIIYIFTNNLHSLHNCTYIPFL